MAERRKMVDTIVDTITEHIHPFVPVPEKIDLLVEKLLHDYLWTSDEYRNETTVSRIVAHYVTALNARLYEYGDFDALLVIKGIIPGWKADVTLKIINPKFWGKQAVREFRQFLDYAFREFNLKRISTSTADSRMVAIARMGGFEEDGRYQYGFKWDNNYYDDIYLSIVR